MKLHEFLGLYMRLDATYRVTDNELAELHDYMMVNNEWLDDVSGIIKPLLNDEIELIVEDMGNDYDNIIKVGGYELTTSTINDTNVVYEAALRGEDLSKYGW